MNDKYSNEKSDTFETLKQEITEFITIKEKQENLDENQAFVLGMLGKMMISMQDLKIKNDSLYDEVEYVGDSLKQTQEYVDRVLTVVERIIAILEKVDYNKKVDIENMRNEMTKLQKYVPTMESLTKFIEKRRATQKMISDQLYG